MIPVLGLDQVRVKWLVIEKEGYLLFGFLLYTNSDRIVVDFMKDGIVELDDLSGEKCAVFVIESPSKEWLHYSRQTKHPWWRLFGEEISRSSNISNDAGQPKEGHWWDSFKSLFSSNVRDQRNPSNSKLSVYQKSIIENVRDSVIVIGDGNNLSLGTIMEPDINLLYNRAEALKVARHFNLEATDLPCLIFFKNLNSRVIWKSRLGNHGTQDDLKNFFRNFFTSPEFESLVYETRS